MPIAVVIFLIVIVALVPFLSIYNLQMIESIKAVIVLDKSKLYIQSAVNQLFLTALALWAASASLFAVVYKGNLSYTALLGGFIFLAIAFTVGYFSTKDKNLEEDNPGLDLLIPITQKEKLIWVMVNLVAASCEEIIFRGVLFQLFWRTTNNWVAAGIMSALCFGFSHSVQGIKGIIITAVFGFGLQYLTILNDGLLIAMIVHFLYNMGTTFLVLKKEKSKENLFIYF